MRFSRKKKIDWESDTYIRARFHYLLQIIYGESLAVDYCRTMSTFAPTPEARDFLLQQQQEEDAHLELLTDVVAKMKRPHVPISKHMHALHLLMQDALDVKDWATCILIQNFIVEGFSITLCEQQGAYGDEQLQKVFATILRDEEKHVAFGVAELKKIITADRAGVVRKRLVRTQRKALYRSILLFKDLAPDADDLGFAWDDLAEKVVRDHMERIEQAGFTLPWTDRIFLKGAIAFFVVI